MGAGVDYDIGGIGLERLVVSKSPEPRVSDAYFRCNPVKVHAVSVIDLVLGVLLIFFFRRFLASFFKQFDNSIFKVRYAAVASMLVSNKAIVINNYMVWPLQDLVFFPR